MENKVRLIDANAAALNTHKEIYWTESEAAAVRNFLAHQPTIDPESLRPKGQWVSDEGDILFHCSECGTQISISGDYDDLSWNYCPNCGADMEG